MLKLYHFDMRAIIFALVSLIFTSCMRDELAPKAGVSSVDGMVSFVATMGDAGTKSDGSQSVAKKTIGSFVMDGRKVFLACEESSLSGTIGSDAASTKGTPVNSANFNDIYGSFSVDCAISEDGETIVDALPAIDGEGNLIEWDYGDWTGNVYFYDVPFVKSDGRWIISPDFPEYQSFYWPKRDYSAGSDPSNYFPLSFFAYAPSYVMEPKQGTPWAGSYTYPGPDGESYPTQSFDGKVEFYHLLDYWDERNITLNPDYTISRNSERFEVCVDDAEKQPDLLLASSGIVNCPQDGNPVPLKFYHILSGIRFKVADAFPVGTTINYIRFDNVWWDGYCSFDPNASGSTSADKVSWSFPSDCARASFRQNFNVEVAASRDFVSGQIQGGDFLYKDDVTKTFMMIPQSFGSSGNSPEATICIGVTINGEDNEIEVPLPEGTQWQAGKLYTYSLSLTFNDNEDGVDIEVIEDFEEPASITDIYYKEKVKIENTVIDPYYLRVAILAYEIDSKDNVWNWWEDETQWLYTYPDAGVLDDAGSFPDYVWGTWSLTGDGWIKIGDYYYYRYPLAGGTSTKTIFDRLRVPCLTTDRAEVDIITQGVPWDAGEDHKATVRTYWGEDVAALLSDSPEE